MEGYASLINMFLMTMIMHTKTPCLINCDNDGDERKLEMQDGQIFYQAAIQFKDTFTSLMGKKIKNLKAINVKTNYSDMPKLGEKNFHWAANRLCGRAFGYLGLRDTITI